MSVFHTIQNENSTRFAERYRAFMEQKAIADFKQNGGVVSVATHGISIQYINCLIQEGQKLFSEKFVQEFSLKKQHLDNLSQIKIRFSGTIQTNKLNRIISDCALIESLSTVRHAKIIAQRYENRINPPSLFVQVNIGKEPQKQGVFPEHADELIEACKKMGLPIIGLRALPPISENPAPYFTQLRRLTDKHQLTHCQMGVSKDYKIAIDCGSTGICVGKIIFQEVA